MTDGQIVDAVLSGETGRFGELIERYLPLVRSVCGGYEFNPESRDDLVQETFVEGYLRLDRLRDRNRVGPWLAQIARNRGKNWIRAQRRRGEAYGRLAKESVEASPSTPFTEASRREMQEWVLARVHELPLKTRSAMLLFYVEGYSTVEAASALGVRESAVRKRLQFGREKIGAQLLEDVRVQDRVEDSKEQRSRIWAAMPLGGAAWLEGGGVSSAAGVIGFGGLLSKWMVVPAVVVLLGVGVFASPGLLRDDLEIVEEPTKVVVDSLSPSGVGGNGGDSDPVAEADADFAVDAEEVETGTLSVLALYRLYDSNETERDEVSVPELIESMTPGDSIAVPGRSMVDGPPIAGALVRLIPTEVSLSSEMALFLEENGFTPREREFAVSTTLWGRASVDEQKTSDLWQSYRKKLDDLKLQGKPLPNRRVRAVKSFDRVIEAETDLDGTVRFAELPAGSYTVQGFARRVDLEPESEGRSSGIVRIVSDGLTEKTVRLLDEISEIRGVVQDQETSEPIKGLSLVLRGDASSTKGPRYAGSMEHGEFRFFLADTEYGAFELDVVGDSHTASTYRGYREIGKPVFAKIEVKVNRSAAVYGRVLKADGTPAANVSIMRRNAASNMSSGVATSDENGEYRAEHDGGIVTLSGAKSGVGDSC